jgi:hypothetical protein
MASRRAADACPRLCQLFVDCGAQGFGGAGHGHADALSVQLAANGRLWLSDPGTCEYVGGNGLRDRFRGTAAHNTLTVDGRDQAEPSGPFSWSALPRIEPRRWVPGETFTVFEGRHFGYERLPAPVVHRRWIVGCGDGFWLVRDVAEGQGTHRLEIRWRFAPGLDVTARGAAAAACEGGESLTLLGEENENWRLSVEDSDYSPSYGARVTTRVARWSHEGPCPAEFAAAICFEAKDEARLTRMGGEPAGAAGYEYAAGDVRRRFFFGAGNVTDTSVMSATGMPSARCACCRARPNAAARGRIAGSLARPCSSTAHTGSGTPRARRSGTGLVTMREIIVTIEVSSPSLNGPSPAIIV